MFRILVTYAPVILKLYLSLIFFNLVVLQGRGIPWDLQGRNLYE